MSVESRSLLAIQDTVPTISWLYVDNAETGVIPARGSAVMCPSTLPTKQRYPPTRLTCSNVCLLLCRGLPIGGLNTAKAGPIECLTHDAIQSYSTPSQLLRSHSLARQPPPCSLPVVASTYLLDLADGAQIQTQIAQELQVMKDTQ